MDLFLTLGLDDSIETWPQIFILFNLIFPMITVIRCSGLIYALSETKSWLKLHIYDREHQIY